MEGIARDGEVVVVPGADRTLTYRPRRVELSDGTTLEHESRGGSLSSVWAADLGERYVEVVHVGHGPEGGELVLVVPDVDTVVLGDLVRSDLSGVTAEWAGAIDLAIGLARPETQILTADGTVSRDDLEDFHQRLLGVLHG